MLSDAIRLQVLRVAGAVLWRVAGRKAPPAAGPFRLLLIRPDHLGDVLLSLPAVDRLIHAFPDARVLVAVGPWGRPALGRHPDFDVLTCPFPGFSRAAAGRIQPYILLCRYARRLRRMDRFDAALIMRPDHWWGAWLAALAGIPVRVGYETPETAPFLTYALPRLPDRHSVEESIDLAGAAIAALSALYPAKGVDGRPRSLETDGRRRASGHPVILDRASTALPRASRNGTPSLLSLSTSVDDEAVTTILKQCGLGDAPIVVLHPGSGSALKAWPLDRFAQVGNELSRSLGARLAVTGTAAERTLADELCASLPAGSANLAGRLDWQHLAALLRRAALVVGVDSGPMHLAVAAETPSVVLFGPASPAQFGPWGSPDKHRLVAADLPCRPCCRLDLCRLEPRGGGPPPCMRAIAAASVLAAAHDVLLLPGG